MNIDRVGTSTPLSAGGEAGNSGQTPPNGNAWGYGKEHPDNGNNGNGGNGNDGNNGGGNDPDDGDTTTGVDKPDKFVYFYHPDHLGSSSYITDVLGEVVQHIEYFAFGETFLEEHSNTERTPYLFNGKELDEETGLYYYGARYYDPVTSVWQSVDPLAEEFPSWSPYNYTLNNPVKYIDPNGKRPWPGVTYIFFEAEAGAGLLMDGANALTQSGVARDQVGKTHFILRHTGSYNPGTLDETVIYGAGASVNAGIEQSWQSETFLGDQDPYGLTNTMAEVSASAGVGATIGVGYKRFSLEVGLGIELRAQTQQTEIHESISLTYKEAKSVNKSSSGNHSWGLANRTTEKDENGYFWANVTIDVGPDLSVTNQSVFSKDGKMWMSQNYFEQAKIAEENDKK